MTVFLQACIKTHTSILTEAHRSDSSPKQLPVGAGKMLTTLQPDPPRVKHVQVSR